MSLEKYSTTEEEIRSFNNEATEILARKINTNGIDVALEKEARKNNDTIDHYIKHLSLGKTGDFYEVSEETRQGHCESLLHRAIEIVSVKGSEKLNRDMKFYFSAILKQSKQSA